MNDILDNLYLLGNKLNVNRSVKITKALLGGFCISIGAMISIFVQMNFNNAMGKCLGALVFAVGLILIILLGGELFTSSCLQLVGVLDKRVKLKPVLLHLILVYICNLLGVLLGVLLFTSIGNFSLNMGTLFYINDMIQGKLTKSNLNLLVSGILCNMFVCTAAIFGMQGKSLVDKVVGITIPISVFVYLGLEHSIADMLYIFSFLKLSVILECFSMLLFVTVGNIVGGLLVSLVMLKIHKK